MQIYVWMTWMYSAQLKDIMNMNEIITSKRSFSAWDNFSATTRQNAQCQQTLQKKNLFENPMKNCLLFQNVSEWISFQEVVCGCERLCLIALTIFFQLSHRQSMSLTPEQHHHYYYHHYHLYHQYHHLNRQPQSSSSISSSYLTSTSSSLHSTSPLSK